MQKLYSELIGMPVFDEYSTSPVALIQDVLIDPENGKLVAFLLKNRHIIVPLDISRFTTGVFIHDRDRIVLISDVLRAEAVWKNNIQFVGSRVFTQKEKLLLGRCIDFEIDTTTMVLTRIIVAKTFFFFHYQERIISFRHIVRVEKGKIIVKDIRESAVKEEIASKSSAFA